MTTIFNDPFFIGFENMLHSANRKAVGFPPYNLVKLSDNDYIIELATAGFNKSELTISLDKNILEISGQKVESAEISYLHKGISSKNFVRTFTVAETIEVESASYDNGILTIRLKNNIPQKTPKLITIV